MGEAFVTISGDKISPEEVISYLRDNIENYGSRCRSALDMIGHMRAPLRMVDSRLYDEIEGYLEEFCLDNDVVSCSEEYEEMEVDPEVWLWP